MHELKEINKSFFPVFCELASASQEEWSQLLCFTPNTDFFLEQTFSDPDFDPELLLGLFCEKKLVGAVLGIIRKWKTPDTGFIKFIIVEDNHRQEETGRELLTEIEKRLRQKGASKIFYGSCSPYYLFPGVFIDDTPLRSMLASCGWQESSERISRIIDIRSMTITESTFNKRLEAGDISLTVASEAEKDEVLGFIEAEFSKSWAKETEPTFITDNPAFCSIARDMKGNIIGFAAIHSCNPNWFGPMGVSAKLRERGIGRLLVCHSLLHAKKQGAEKLLLPWINDKDTFYSKIIGKMEKHTYFKVERN
jgi:N-acetylglutamate synthase-like GNAT family acetyltransferase